MRVLIVSPHFPPSSTPDMQRVRTILPFLRENGWEAEVLAVDPDAVSAPRDPWLAEGLPAHVPVHRATVLGLGWSRVPGLGTPGFRAISGLRRLGNRVLASGRFDAVYFSTTVFEINTLGPVWKRRFAVPFVLDYQDPWVNDYYRDHPHVVPPGGRLKYAVVDQIHKWMERRTFPHASGITSVSPAYPRSLMRRYGSDGLRVLVEPFPAALQDFERVKQQPVRQERFDSADGAVHWLYAGVFTPAMLLPLRSFFRALRDAGTAKLPKRLKLHFIGTSYASGAAPQISPIAREYGLEHLVDELPARVAYSEVLQCLQDANALLAFGSDDPGYTASKVYPCLMARKPLLTVVHERSPVNEILAKTGGAVRVQFGEGDSEQLIASRIGDAWITNAQHASPVALDETALAASSDRASAARVSEFLRECIEH